MHQDHDYHLFQGTKNYVSDIWRSVRIWKEFCTGFTKLRKLNHCVTFFGSARFPPDHPYYGGGK